MSYNDLEIRGNTVTLHTWDASAIGTGDLFKSFTIIKQHIVGVVVNYNAARNDGLNISFTVSTGYGGISVEYAADRAAEMCDDYESLCEWLEAAS